MIAHGNQLVLVSVGNTHTRIAIVKNGQLEPSQVSRNDDHDALIRSISEHTQAPATRDNTTVLIASVNRPIADVIISSLNSTGFGDSVGVFGDDLPVPIEDAVADRAGVGQDRLFNALGAFASTNQACIVIDAGTAITIDFVDGTGVFVGGAIAPGVQMMLDALHERTDALPQLDARRLPEANVFGKSTEEAITRGVVSAARGACRVLIDEYAIEYEAYPFVVATGGDAPLLFADDPFIERVVPDLTLIGMRVAFDRIVEAGDEADA